MDKNVIKTSKAQKEVLDLMVARYFFSSNTAFRQIESTAFINMINYLRPGYKPPSRKALSSTLLETVYDEVETSLQTELKSMSDTVGLTLCQDGWSSLHSDPIIASSIHVGKNTFLLSSKDCGVEKKTAEYCFEEAVESINICKEKYDKDVRIRHFFEPKYKYT